MVWPHLTASPDDKVTDPDAPQPLGIAEYKNPFSVRDLTMSQACDNKMFCLERREEGQITYKLKRRHDYYYQIQCQLYCYNVDWCDFVVRTKTYTLNVYIEINTGGNNNCRHLDSSTSMLFCRNLLAQGKATKQPGSQIFLK